MRSAFSPAAMLTEEGSINQEFFKPTKVLVSDALTCISLEKCVSSTQGFYCRWLWSMTRNGATMREICCTRCSKCIQALYSTHTLGV